MSHVHKSIVVVFLSLFTAIAIGIGMTQEEEDGGSMNWPFFTLSHIRGVVEMMGDGAGIRVRVEADHDPVPDEINGFPIYVQTEPLYNEEDFPPPEIDVDERSPQQKAWEEILDRNLEQLSHIPGFKGAGVGADGIHVALDPLHGEAPDQVEGVPIHVDAAKHWQFAGWSETVAQRPLTSALAMGTTQTLPYSNGSITTIVSAHGQPWHLFPTHLLQNLCTSNAPQPMYAYGGKVLGLMNRYQTSQGYSYQPGAVYGTIPNMYAGRIETWDNLLNHLSELNAGTDFAAAATDNNTQTRDLSMGSTTGATGAPTTPEVKPWIATGTQSQMVTLKGAKTPCIGMTVNVYSPDISDSGYSIIPVYVYDAGDTDIVSYSCSGAGYTFVKSAFHFVSTNGVLLSYGDSGSPVISSYNCPGYPATTGNYLVGMLDFVDTTDPTDAGGIEINLAKTSLEYDNLWTSESQ